MKQYPHPFIVKIIDDFLDNSKNQCIVEEYFSEGDFYIFLIERRKNEQKFQEKEILQFLANIIKIVHYLNSHDIYHRDLKPANFLIKTEKNGRIYLYLNDFGLAKNTNPDYIRLTSSIGSIKGTIGYLAPEILDGKPEKPNISKQDVWSIGVIAY